MSKQGIKDNWELVKKWTFQGADIQFYLDDAEEWRDILSSSILWAEGTKYREKPKEKTELEKAMEIVVFTCEGNHPMEMGKTKEAFRVVYEHEQAENSKHWVRREFDIHVDHTGRLITNTDISTRLMPGEIIKTIEVIE